MLKFTWLGSRSLLLLDCWLVHFFRQKVPAIQLLLLLIHAKLASPYLLQAVFYFDVGSLYHRFFALFLTKINLSLLHFNFLLNSWAFASRLWAILLSFLILRKAMIADWRVVSFVAEQLNFWCVDFFLWGHRLTKLLTNPIFCQMGFWG